MRAPASAPETRRGVGERSRKEVRGWGAVVAEHASEDWPPADWPLSAGAAQAQSHRAKNREAGSAIAKSQA